MSKPLKIIFAGTPEFAAKYLQALLNTAHCITAVITQPDKPAGRGRKIQINPVKQLSIAHNITVYQPKNLRDAAIQQTLKNLTPDVIIDVACGLFVPKEILELPTHGCINIHPSLLPRWRGASPIQRAILSGDKETGISIMLMDEGLDTGPVFLQKKYLIQDDDTTATLLKNLAPIGIDALIEVLNKIPNNEIIPKKQDDSKSSYANKITKQDAKINWHKSAAKLAREVRAFNPWPISYAQIDDQTVRIWQADTSTATTNKNPGEIISINDQEITVATGDGVLRILAMQFPGKKALPLTEILKSKLEFFKKFNKFT